MRRFRIPLTILALAAAVLALATAGSTDDPRRAIRDELPSLLPPGANLYLGFTDLAADLDRLGNSHLWGMFQGDENHEAFVRSRLWLRFQDRLTALESLVGAPLDGPSMQSMAAGTCALAFYQVGDIEFVYLAREEVAEGLLRSLGEMTGDFQTARHGDVSYRIVRDDARGLARAWPSVDGYLVVSDRERLLHESLDRIAGSGASLADDPGFREVVEGLPPDGDQLLYLNLASLRDDGYFRRYWLQKDRVLLERHDAFGATAVWDTGQVSEHRLLSREVDGAPDAPDAPDPTEVFRVLPGDSLAAKAFSAADPAEAAAVFLDGGRESGEPLDGFRTPLHDLLEAGAISRAEFDALAGDRFAVAVMARQYDASFTLLDRVVATRPADRTAADAAFERVVATLPSQVTGRLAGDTTRPFPLVTRTVGGTEVLTFDLYTRGVYAPTLAWVDGWLVMANTVEGATAVIEAASGKNSLDRVGDARRLATASGPMRQALYLDVAASTEAYHDVLDAMERGETFRSWTAEEFWGQRMQDLVGALESIRGVRSWSTETPTGLRGETVYLLEG